MPLVDRQYAATLEAARLRPDCLDTLRALRARGVRTQIVSNIDDEQLDGLVARLGLDAVIDTWTSSESARSCKPDARIYQVALAAAGCDAGEVLFVGDTVEHDVVGPRAQGMRTALLVADARPGAIRRRRRRLRDRAPRPGGRAGRRGARGVSADTSAEHARLREYLDAAAG